MRSFKTVVLPAPFGPTMPILESSWTSRSMCLRSGFPGEYPKETLVIWIMGGESFSTSGNLKCTVYTLSGGSSIGIFSSFLIRDWASDDLAAL